MVQLCGMYVFNILLVVYYTCHVAAGTDTTRHTLYWFLQYMVMYPNVQTKMQKEIDEVLGKINRVLHLHFYSCNDIPDLLVICHRLHCKKK